jgi:hypothetical protein
LLANASSYVYHFFASMCLNLKSFHEYTPSGY